MATNCWPETPGGGSWPPRTRRVAPPRVLNALERGTESEVAHKWAGLLHNPCRLGGPQRFKAGDRIRSGLVMGYPCILGDPQQRGRKAEAATSPLPSRGPKRGRNYDLTPKRGTKSEVAHRWVHRLHACIFSKNGNFFLCGKVVYFFEAKAGKKNLHIL